MEVDSERNEMTVHETQKGSQHERVCAKETNAFSFYATNRLREYAEMKGPEQTAYERVCKFLNEDKTLTLNCPEQFDSQY